MRAHPAFLIFFVLSWLTILASLFFAISTDDICGGYNDPEPGTAKCALAVESHTTTAYVLALGGLAAMIGAVGFQVNRYVPQPPVPVPPAGFPIQGGHPVSPGFPPAGAPGQPPLPHPGPR